MTCDYWLITSAHWRPGPVSETNTHAYVIHTNAWNRCKNSKNGFNQSQNVQNRTIFPN